MGDQYDAPNQQAVRPDGSGPADEGEGGSTRTKKQEREQEREQEAQESSEARKGTQTSKKAGKG